MRRIFTSFWSMHCARPRSSRLLWVLLGHLSLAAVAAAGSTPVQAAPVAAPKATVIGAVVPDSWPDKTKGEDIRNGMMLALKIWPGQPTPTLLVKDSACDQKKSAAATQELIEAKVDVVLGGWCELGALPRLLREAGIPFVSANAERISAPPELTMQLGVVPVNLANTISSQLRAEAGLRVTASSACWIDYEQRVPDGYDAAICPSFRPDNARWADVAPTYAAAYRKPFTPAAARGYAAMQVALAAIKQMRAGSKPAAAFKDLKEVATVLGTVKYHDDSVPEDAMQLLLAAKLPRLNPRESAALDELMKSKGCGCTKGVNCPQSKAWGNTPLALQCCTKGGPCGSEAVAGRH